MRLLFRRARTRSAVLTARALVTFIALVTISAGAPGGASPAAHRMQPRYCSGVNLVEVYATVTLADGAPVSGLAREDFELTEDGVPQAITIFAAGNLPLSVALAIDRSWSMTEARFLAAKEAARSFLDGLGPGDRAMILAIGSEVEAVTALSRDRLAWTAGVDSLRRWGTTPLYDAVIAGLDLVDSSPGRRALILLSDGDDRYSSATARQALERARRADVIVYPVAVGKNHPPFFAELVALAGGRSFQADDVRRLRAVLSTISREMRSQYLLGYTPTRPITPGAEHWRTIRVNTRKEGARVRARDGYWAK